MEDSLFEKIINNLVDLDFKGRVMPYINNELLLDKKILNRIDYIKEKLGDNITITIGTNGKLLTLKKIYKLFEKGVDQIGINDYADNWIQYCFYNKNIRRILRNIDIYKINRNVGLLVCHRLKKQKLSDRSRKVKGRKMSLTKKFKFCDFPFYFTN